MTNKELIKKIGRKCAGCKTKENLSIDHIIPRSKGGLHVKENLQVLCRSCNSIKSDNTVDLRRYIPKWFRIRVSLGCPNCKKRSAMYLCGQQKHRCMKCKTRWRQDWKGSEQTDIEYAVISK